ATIDAPLSTTKYSCTVATNGACGHPVDSPYRLIAGPPTPAVTFMKPDAAPATTAPGVPRSTRARSLASTATSATRTSPPAVSASTGAGRERATQAPGTTAATAGTARKSALRTSTARQVWPSTTTFVARLSALASSTPVNGPRRSTRNGALTSAKPSPVSRCVPAPTSTATPTRTSSATPGSATPGDVADRSEEHTSELQ